MGVKRRHSRRALSTVVTSMLLVTAVSIMGTGLVAWSNSNLAVQQLNISNQAASRIDLIRESFVIEDVWFYESGTKKADVTIRNTGDLPVTISKIYLNNSQTWTGDQVITTGNVTIITINASWQPDNAQSIWIVTERGSEAKQTWKS